MNNNSNIIRYKDKENFLNNQKLRGIKYGANVKYNTKRVVIPSDAINPRVFRFNDCMRKLHLIYIIIATVFLVGCGADQAMKKGDKFYALGEYFDAATQYRRAYAQTPVKERKLRGQRALKMADCYRRINYTQRAIAAYRNALRYGQQDSMTAAFEECQLQRSNKGL